MPDTRTREDIKKMVENVSKALIQNQQFINTFVAQIVTEVSCKYEKQLGEMNKKMNELQEVNDKLKWKVDYLEQNSKKHNLLIFGITEEQKENPTDKLTDIFNNKLDLNINKNDIHKCFRIKSKVTNLAKEQSDKTENKKPRPILVEFNQRYARNLIFNNKKKLKSTGIVIREDLTSNRYKIWKSCVEAIGVKNVWTTEGTIYALFGNKKIIVKDINDIPKPDTGA